MRNNAGPELTIQQRIGALETILAEQKSKLRYLTTSGSPVPRTAIRAAELIEDQLRRLKALLRERQRTH